MSHLYLFRLLAGLVSITALSTASCVAQPFDPAPTTLSIMTWNVEWMFDDYTGDNRSKLSKEQSAPSREAWKAKVTEVAKVIAQSKATIVALQEIESDQTLAAIAQELKATHQLRYRYAFIQGTDSFTEQDVGFLVQGGLTSYRRQEQSKAMFDSGTYYNLSKQLFAEFRWENVESPLTLLNVHFRATEGAEDFRVRQAKLARHWSEPMLAARQDVVILGDFNSETKAGELRSDVGAIIGDGQSPTMVDLLTRSENPTAQTHLILDRQFDRIMVSQSMLDDGPGLDWSFHGIEILSQAIIRGKRDGQEHWDQRLTMSSEELDVSDHFPVLAKFELK
jgi:endonuclease/exonuclease/phosphatase family metal-dependent hydrolase